VQRDFLTKDIVAEAPASKREAILTFSGAYSFELLDVVAPGAVVRVGGKDLAHAILDTFEFFVPPQELFKKTFIVRCGPDMKKRRHGSAPLSFEPPSVSDLRDEVLDGSTLSSQVVLVTLSNVLADLGVTEFEVVLKFINTHDASNGNAILL